MQGTGTQDTESQLALARIRWQQSDVVAAETILHGLHARDPAHAEVANLLAEALRSQGRLGAACDVQLALCRAQGFPQGLSLEAATFARQSDRHVVAAQICTAALSADAASPDLLVLAGHVARESGDFDAARGYYRHALDAGVDLGQHYVLAALANTGRCDDPADPLIARCERHFQDRGFSARSRASAGFGLAKLQDDLGDYAAAARTLYEANAMVRGVWRWDNRALRRMAESGRALRVARARDLDDARFVPVFIVGLPRTGTTLIATRLAQTTVARDRGELRWLRFIAEQLTRGAHLDDPNALTEAAKLYRAQSRQDDSPATWYIDQDPLNFRFLHIVAVMFPDARVVHCRRDRRDTALSLWSQDFQRPDEAFAYAFEDIRAFAAGHDVLMARWQQTLPLPIHELDYEALVSRPAETLETLREFIGAPRCAPDARPDSAPLQSASVWQARQPIHSRSVGRWRAYAPHVPELMSRETGHPEGLPQEL